MLLFLYAQVDKAYERYIENSTSLIHRVDFTVSLCVCVCVCAVHMCVLVCGDFAIL